MSTDTPAQAQLELATPEQAAAAERELDRRGAPVSWAAGYRVRTVDGEAAIGAGAARLAELVLVDVASSSTWAELENQVLEQAARQLELLRGLVTPGCRLNVRVAVWLPSSSVERVERTAER